VALVINPALAARYMKMEADVVNRPKWTKIGSALTVLGLILNVAVGLTTLGSLLFWPGLLTLTYIWGIEPWTNRFMVNGLPKLEAWYERRVSWVLAKNNASKTLWSTVGLFILSFVLMGIIPPKVVFFPDNQPNLANIYIEMPVGTDIEETNKITQEIEDQILELVKKYEYEVDGESYNYMVESVIAQVGKGTSDPREGPSNVATPNKAKVVVAFRETKYREDQDGNRVASAQPASRQHLGDPWGTDCGRKRPKRSAPRRSDQH
jgi:multidrug efflux pump subunit AcrB